MANELAGKKVAILAADNFEQVELTDPKKALEEAGAVTHIIAPKPGKIQGVHHDKPGDSFDVDVPLSNARPEDYDALLLPGGLMSPDELRQLPEAISFVKEFYTSGKAIGAICHGPWLLIEADVVRGRKVTGWPAIKTDLINAGGNYSDVEVATDMGLVTSRKPADIPAFSKKLIEEIGEGTHDRS